MKSYLEYRDSTIEWIGKIPKHWQVLRNFAIFSDRSDRGYPHFLPFSVTQQSGVIPQEYTSDQIVRSSGRTENGKRICTGDLVYNKMRMWQGAVGVAPAEGRVSTAYVVCQPIRDLIPEFFEYLYRTPLYITQSLRFSYGGCKDQYCLYPKDFKNIYTIFPPKQEQAQIVNFLDRKTERIDELSRIKERQIELLQEQRTALINQAVTKGLDPNVEMKPSGVEWIGEIPAHWNLCMLKYAARLVYGDTLISENRENGVVPVYGSNGIIDIHSSANTSSPAIIVGRKGSLGKVQYSDVPCFVIDTAYYIDRRTSHVNLRWLYYILQSLKLERFRNSVLPGLNRESAESQYIPLIREEEQVQIADFLNHKTKQIDELIATEQRKIELLKEYRQSLISEAVTGKIDVRNEA